MTPRRPSPFYVYPGDHGRLTRRPRSRRWTDWVLSSLAFLILVFMGMVIFLGLFW